MHTAAETIFVAAPTPFCDGTGPGLGHPRVFLKWRANDEVNCPYCGRRFARKEGKTNPAH